jgi:L-asparagine transporter-like permease
VGLVLELDVLLGVLVIAVLLLLLVLLLVLVFHIVLVLLLLLLVVLLMFRQHLVRVCGAGGPRTASRRTRIPAIAVPMTSNLLLLLLLLVLVLNIRSVSQRDDMLAVGLPVGGLWGPRR